MSTHATNDDRVAGIRACIRLRVKNIPGEILKRPWTLGQIFCQFRLQRDLDPLGDSHSFDDFRIPGGFDSEEDVKRWFVYDLGVEGQVARTEHHRITHEVYRGCRMEDGSL